MMAGVSGLGSQFKQMSQINQLSYISSLFSGGGLQTQGTSMFQPDAGLYGYGVNRSSASALAKLQISAIKQGGGDLSAAVATLNTPSLYGGLTADKPGFSSKPQAVSVNTAQLATAQVNKSAGMQAFERPGLSGTQTFAIEQNGKKSLFSVDLTSADTNRTAQQKIADAVNADGGSDFTARVSYDDATGNSSLLLTAKETGEENAFSVTDINGTAAAQFGLNNVAAAAQDALFSVDGVNLSSASNTVDVGGGASVTLTEVGEQTYNLYSNASSAKDALSEFISQFNRLTDTAGATASPKLADRLNAIYRQSATDLAKVGIYSGVDGKLRMNEQLVERAAADGSLEEALGVGEKGGFLDLVGTAAAEADKNPAKFAGETNGSAVNYSSLYDASYGTDYKLYAAEMMASNMGMLFDYLM